MSATVHELNITRDRRVTLGPNHGYRFEGDTAILNAELSIPVPLTDPSRDWALQLWACAAPHDGGRPDGIKVAEAPLELTRAQSAAPRLETTTVAHLPAGQQPYAMVLVLASGARGVYDQVHDFANYAAPQQFVAPHFEGSVGYRIDDGVLTLEAERVKNPRATDNLSGSLSLELWAHSAPYAGGDVAGTRLGQLELAPLAGQASYEALALGTALTTPPAGTWQLTLMLREWTAAEGYRTRDYRTFPTPYVVAAREPSPTNLTVVSTPTLSAVPAPANDTRAEVRVPAKVEPLRPVRAPSKVAPPPRAVASEAPKAARSEPPVLTAVPSATVSVQHAPIEVLMRVPGLNKRLAAAIVRARPFNALEDLTRVRGIGDKLLRSLRVHLTL